MKYSATGGMVMTNGNLTVLSVGVSLGVNRHRERGCRRRNGKSFQPGETKFVFNNNNGIMVLIINFWIFNTAMACVLNFHQIFIRSIKALVEVRKFSLTT
jgi:hypothetical protein